MTPYLWFDTQAAEAAAFYCGLFPDSRIISRSVIRDTPSGDCETVSFEVWGQSFEAISAGPRFLINPSISFMVNFDPLLFTDSDDPTAAAKELQDRIWKQLAEGGEVRMEYGRYDFSSSYGWVQDRFGLDWQLILTDPEGDPRPAVMPSMLFTGEACGKAEEAGEFYRSVFADSAEGLMVHYPSGMEPDGEDTVMFSDFRLDGTWMTAADSAYDHKFRFNEAVSFKVGCGSQEEIDHYWEKLSAVPEAEQCGWLKDRYGVSWQIVPSVLNELMEKGTPGQQQALTGAFLKMKKFIIEDLHRAFNR